MQSRVTSLIAVLLLVSVVAWGQQNSAPVAHRLSQAEAESWLAAGLAENKPLRFFSSRGKRDCCDVPNTELEFMPGQRFHVLIDGYAQSVYTLPFAVQADGKIAAQSENNALSEWLVGQLFANTYLYRYGADLYLVPASVSTPDFSVAQRTFWPLVFVSTGDWR